MNRLFYLLILMVSFSNNLLAAGESVLGEWETTDQYGYGYMIIESEKKGKIVFYGTFSANEFIEVELTDFEKTEDGFDLKMELKDDLSTIISGTGSYSDHMLCLKVNRPEEPNLMCFMRPERVNLLREKAINEHEKTQ
ncbi:hypothetical protein [Arenicella xantha]|uniref:DUF2147 domain-containing protein n=1 Tax=Arenicella xantha TaxID=644221 RepID=A0A395JNM2_9GAMM|nr:hypothetical protein [Arenicella xantha]RBP51188.1 hypothetical protein DFR28_102607 [Arenicella xantha]